MKPIAVLAIPVILSACGGGGEESSALLSDFSMVQEDVCATSYYTELAGDYRGQVSFFSPITACLWSVEMQVNTNPGSVPGTCDTDINMTSDLIDGDALCDDLGIAGQLLEPYMNGIGSDELDALPWPVDTTVVLDTDLGTENVYPVGTTLGGREFALRFDGLGNMTFPASDATEFFNSALVKSEPAQP